MTGERSAILVTGAAGYVGSAVTLAMLDAGYPVIALDNLTTGRRWMVDARAKFYEGAIENASLVRSILDMNAVAAVVHCAGSGPGANMARDPLQQYRNNSAASGSLIESAIACRVQRLVLLSHAAVYGAGPGAMMAEAAEVRPANAFAQSVYMTEQMLRDAAEAHSLDYAVVRYPGAAGADARNRVGRPASGSSDLIGLVVDRILGEEVIFGRSTQSSAPPAGARFDSVHVSDLGAALAAVVEWSLRNPGCRELFNCGSGSGFDVTELVAEAERVGQFQYDPALLSNDLLSASAPVLDSSRIRTLTRWKPERSQLDLMLRDELRWRMRLPPHERQRSAAALGPAFFTREPIREVRQTRHPEVRLEQKIR